MADRNFLRRLLAKDSEPSENAQKPTRLTLSSPVLIALSLVLVCAVAWAFFMGFMVGRGQSPQAEIHAITGMLEPEKQQEHRPPPDMAETGPGPDAPASPQENAIPVPAPMPAALPQAPVASPQTRAQAAAAKPQAKEQTREQAGQIFSYTFQLAAFKTQREAAKVQKTAVAKGLKAVIRKSGKAYLVTASLRGGPAEVAKLRGTLKSMKLGKPMQLSKTPVNASNAKRTSGKKQERGKSH